ncbi:MAG: glutamine--tRNA ligase/YqeY domain fusion protein [Gammaproteobacteria bacterium]|nr:glutamine--tRNA ligase/YqeY domain fusion protein [Gammaproteobacteria bacterium]MDH4313854.1 glutamine--tRNA ligase/YqeY domain fusion protein [Gammaproteobacteria bacterium]MDH5213668.1 glutamine--tRNA ligase/YqeY domain fusion protein [Gammaproteobacteria bacterium]
MNDNQPKDFIRQIIAEDIASGKHGGAVVTRFPPEPNGFLHVGHAKSICLNFGVAAENKGRTFLRFDDTNPGKESEEYVRAIKDDVRWLGFDWNDRLSHASDYFDQLYEAAESLIRKGVAYVDSLTAEQIREFRGTLTQAGKNSPHRDRSVDENIDLFRRMRAGEFADGEHVLRAKIDMSSPNINLRDPTLYRIRHVSHQHTGDKWCIYPMYDFAHGLSDAFEGITHSLCTLEFEDHRPLYDWFLDQLEPPHRPRQIEFSRLNLAFALTSKRKLNQLVSEGVVNGWDDPRLATLAGMRRRGYPAAAIRDFCQRIGVTKKENMIEMALLENCIRENLDLGAKRRMAVMQPLKITLTNYEQGKTEMLTAQNHPSRPELGSREVPFGREIFIERDDFMEDAPKKYFRLKPGGEVRLRFAYIIRCDEVVKDGEGNVTELLCSLDHETKSGSASSERKVKGTIHWVSAQHAVSAEVRLYDRLFTVADPGSVDDVMSVLNPTSLEVVDAKLEPALRESAAGIAVQFERLGYFTPDILDHSANKVVFNRIVTLRDGWAKIEKQALQQQS